MNKLINLLPDSKIEGEKRQRTRRLATSITTAVIVVTIGVPLLLLGIKGGQNLALGRTQGQIDERLNQLKSTEQLATILTVQDHMASLPELYRQRIFVSELVKIIPSLMPSEIRLSNIEVDVISGTIQISGIAPTYSSAEKFHKSLQFVGVASDTSTVDPDPDLSGLFTNVVLRDISGPSGTEVNFVISATFSFTLLDGVEDE